MRKRGGALYPVAAYDAERLDDLQAGVDIEVTIKQRRSSPQHRLYWATLANVVAATGKWPSAASLHKLLKMELGVTQIMLRLNGEPVVVPDSTAFARMDQAEFQRYFNAAMALLAEATGVDPLAIEKETVA